MVRVRSDLARHQGPARAWTGARSEAADRSDEGQAQEGRVSRRAPRDLACALAVSFLCTPALAAPSPASSVVTWQSVALGERIDAVFTRLGEPRLRRKAIMGTYLLEYEALDGQATLSLTDADGAVTGIRLIASTAGAVHPAAVD